MALSTRSSKLKAINVMLSVIGEAPISSLVTTGRTDVTIALSILDEVIEEVCSEGWYWNTDTDYSLAINADGYIEIPADALSVDPHDTAKNYVARGDGTNTNTLYLWNLDDNTFVFTEAQKCDIIRVVPYDDIPSEQTKRYCMMRAARIFAKRMLGDIDNVEFTTEDLQSARALMEKEDHDTADHSLKQDPTTMNVIGGYRRNGGYL